MDLDSDYSNEDSNIGLDALKNTETSLWELFKTLLSPTTMPHLVMISLLSMILYVAASSDSLTNLTSVIFIGLCGGYTITAICSKYEIVKKWTIAGNEVESLGNNVIRILKKFKICIFPLSMSLACTIVMILIFGENGLIPQLYGFIPLFLASLFIFWSVIQGTSFSSWAASITAKSSDNKTKTADLKVSTAVNGTILITFSLILVSIFQFLKDSSSSFGDVIIQNWLFLIAVIATYVLTSTWTWNLRKISSSNPSINSFANRWNLICHLFLSWHILTIWRQNFMSPNSIEVLLEELILMIFTVFMAIWTLTSKGYSNSFRLLNEENALAWGLAFGYAYAGSVAMLTNVFDEITTVMLIGHGIVILTVVYAYRRVLTKVIITHDDGVEVRRLASQSSVLQEDELEHESSSDESEIDDESNDYDEDWQEDDDVDWEKKTEDNTISSDVEWDESIEID